MYYFYYCSKGSKGSDWNKISLLSDRGRKRYLFIKHVLHRKKTCSLGLMACSRVQAPLCVIGYSTSSKIRVWLIFGFWNTHRLNGSPSFYLFIIVESVTRMVWWTFSCFQFLHRIISISCPHSPAVTWSGPGLLRNRKYFVIRRIYCKISWAWPEPPVRRILQESNCR